MEQAIDLRDACVKKLTSIKVKVIYISLVVIFNTFAIVLNITPNERLICGGIGSLFAILLVFLTFGIESESTKLTKLIEFLSLAIPWASIGLFLRFSILLNFSNYFLNQDPGLMLISAFFSGIIIFFSLLICLNINFFVNK